MEFPRGKPVLVDQFEMQNKEQLYVFYRHSKNQEAPNQSFLLYAKTKNYENEIYSPEFDKRETQVLEALLNSENKEDKKALHKFIVAMYAERKGLTEDIFKELFSPLENIYYRNKLKELETKKEDYVKKIKMKGEMSLDDANMLRNFDYYIYMEKHPLLHKFNNWMYPERGKSDDWKTKLKGIVRRLAVLPVTIGYNISLEIADNHWKKKNIEQYAPDDKNKKKLHRMRLARIMGAMGFTAGVYQAYEFANVDKELKQREKFREIKQEYDVIRNEEKLSEKRIETIMGNTAYVDYEMVRNDQKDTSERIAYLKERIEDKYKEVNPELAALREEERNKVDAGMNPKKAQKERREAVKAYYNKKSQRE